MTSKEKAIELVDKYYDSLPQWVNTNDAKLSALIAVDEILGLDIYQSEEWYWSDVKKEIEKL